MKYETVKDYMDTRLEAYKRHLNEQFQNHDIEEAYKTSIKIEALEHLMLTMPDYLLWFSHK
jgi:hypothetical protein